MKNYNWEYFKSQINKKTLQNQKQKLSTVKIEIDVKNIFAVILDL